MLNSLCLALIDYDPDHAKSDYNKYIEFIGFGFTILFTLELIIKILALGLICHKYAYLRSIWNCIDLFIILSG